MGSVAKQLKSITLQLLPPSLYPTDSATVWVRSNVSWGTRSPPLLLSVLSSLNRTVLPPCPFFHHYTPKMSWRALRVPYILIDYLVTYLFLMELQCATSCLEFTWRGWRLSRLEVLAGSDAPKLQFVLQRWAQRPAPEINSSPWLHPVHWGPLLEKKRNFRHIQSTRWGM